ncbi:PREDICTED: suppressor protein SRP40-like [Nelumbo nucifera]|uniref:Srp40 C-terminal domain-containing protein n=2 Tax=Nelumbo nucifera TaxID=4432 RepID=A0A822ZM81_NELNU|nr:PREDICTED: suppressor protein SRP40-like [Nelumbo nucifera]DAD45863.1 TPA_asm: hypothetical protein HUJ06_004093 [Nelumbo nucifera]
MLSTLEGNSISALIAFQPRQVALARQNMKNKATSEILENDSTEKTLTLKTEQKKKKKQKSMDSSQRALLLHSISAYLDRNGFSKTLKAFRSEALREFDDWKGHSLDLEDMYYKYLDASNSKVEGDINDSKGQDLQKVASKKPERVINGDDISQEIMKKKRKKGNLSDDDTANEQPGVGNGFVKQISDSFQKLANDKVPEPDMKAKDKKKKNKALPDSHGESTQQGLDELDKKSKEKKKKSKLSCESPANTLVEGPSESLKEKSKDVSLQKCKTDIAGVVLEDESWQNKDKKKKKNKLVSDSLVNNAEEGGSEDVEELSKRKSKDKIGSQVTKRDTENTLCEVLLVENNAKTKEKKKKAGKSVSETLCGGDTKEFGQGDLKGIDSMKEDVHTLGESAVDVEKKNSKKRKRLVSEESESQAEAKGSNKDLKEGKTRGSAKDKGTEQHVEVNMLAEADGHAGKKRKTENGHVDSNKSQEISSNNQLYPHANGNPEKDEKGSAMQKNMKKQCNGSAEPKSVNAFRRVKVEEVKFVDERLQDNSYWAKGGAEIGYGAKAQEVLGQVRGRDFRHEKTKKKRGSYRGGQIDLQTHSVKFNYSSDDE